MEQTHVHELQEDKLHRPMPKTAGAELEWPLIQSAATRMTSFAQQNWRWRLLYLRALLDAELTANNCHLTPRCLDISAN